MGGQPLREVLRQALRFALASGLAWEIGRWLGAARPVFAVLAVLVTMQGNAYGSVVKGSERLAGVFLGVALGMAALSFVQLNALVIAGLMLVAALTGARLGFGGRFNNQVGISALLLVGGGHGLAYGVTRAWETAEGGAVGVLITTLLWPADPVRHLAQVLDVTRLRLAADILAVSGALGGSPNQVMGLERAVARHAGAAEGAVADLPELAYGPRWWRRLWGHDAERLEHRLRAVGALYRHLRTLARLATTACDQGARDGAGALAAAGAALAAACEAFAPNGTAQGSATWLDVAEERVKRYCSEAGRQAMVSGPVAAGFHDLVSGMRGALAPWPGPPGPVPVRTGSGARL